MEDSRTRVDSPFRVHIGSTTLSDHQIAPVITKDLQLTVDKRANTLAARSRSAGSGDHINWSVNSTRVTHGSLRMCALENTESTSRLSTRNRREKRSTYPTTLSIKRDTLG